MAEVTESDKFAARSVLWVKTIIDDVEAIEQTFATHREAAAKAERDRIVAWLREMGSIRGGVADAIEALEHLEEKQP